MAEHAAAARDEQEAPGLLIGGEGVARAPGIVRARLALQPGENVIHLGPMDARAAHAVLNHAGEISRREHLPVAIVRRSALEVPADQSGRVAIALAQPPD